MSSRGGDPHEWWWMWLKDHRRSQDHQANMRQNHNHRGLTYGNKDVCHRLNLLIVISDCSVALFYARELGLNMHHTSSGCRGEHMFKCRPNVTQRGATNNMCKNTFRQRQHLGAKGQLVLLETSSICWIWHLHEVIRGCITEKLRRARDRAINKSIKLFSVEVRCNLDFPKKIIIFGKLNSNKGMEINWKQWGYGINRKKRRQWNKIHNRDTSVCISSDTIK